MSRIKSEPSCFIFNCNCYLHLVHLECLQKEWILYRFANNFLKYCSFALNSLFAFGGCWTQYFWRLLCHTDIRGSLYSWAKKGKINVRIDDSNTIKFSVSLIALYRKLNLSELSFNFSHFLFISILSSLFWRRMPFGISHCSHHVHVITWGLRSVSWGSSISTEFNFIAY